MDTNEQGRNVDVGPEADVSMETAVEIACSRAFGGRSAAKIVVLNYTHLYAFTRFYTKFLSGNVNARN